MQYRGRSTRTKVLFPDGTNSPVLAAAKSNDRFFGSQSPTLSSTIAPSDSSSAVGEKNSEALLQEMTFLRARVEKLEGVLQQVCAKFEAFDELLPQENPVKIQKNNFRFLPKVDLQRPHRVALSDLSCKTTCADLCATSMKIEDLAHKIQEDVDLPLGQFEAEEKPQAPHQSSFIGIKSIKAKGMSQQTNRCRFATDHVVQGAKTTTHAERTKTKMSECLSEGAKRNIFASDGQLLSLLSDSVGMWVKSPSSNRISM